MLGWLIPSLERKGMHHLLTVEMPPPQGDHLELKVLNHSRCISSQHNAFFAFVFDAGTVTPGTLLLGHARRFPLGCERTFHDFSEPMEARGVQGR